MSNLTNAIKNCSRCSQQNEEFVSSENVVYMLLDKGADLEEEDEDGRSPLSLAIGYNFFDMIKVFLEKGAKP